MTGEDPVRLADPTPAGDTASPVPEPAPEPAPDASQAPTPAPKRVLGARWWIGGIAIAVLIVVILGPLASSSPDGLERVAADQGFVGQAQNLISGLLGGYGDSPVATILSGLLGIALVGGLLFLLGRVVTRRKVQGRRPLELDRYVEGTSAFHRADARVKLILTLAGILSISLLPDGSWVALAMAWLVLIACSATAGLGPFRLSRSAVVALPFALAALPLIFTMQGEIIGSFALGPFTITVSAEGIRRFLSILIGSWLSVQVALLLAFTTPFHDLVDGLRALRVPKILVAIISFMYRYIAVLSDEASRMLRARESRSAARDGKGGGSLRWRATVAGRLVGSLFLRAYERSERIYAAMQARGFEGEFRHLHARAIERSQVAWLVAMLAILAIYEVTAFLWLPHR